MYVQSPLQRGVFLGEFSVITQVSCCLNLALCVCLENTVPTGVSQLLPKIRAIVWLFYQSSITLDIEVSPYS